MILSMSLIAVGLSQKLIGIVLFQIIDSLLRRFPREYCFKKLLKPRESA